MRRTISEICVFNRRVWLQLFCFVFFVALIALMDLSIIKHQSISKLSKLLENVKEAQSSREDNNSDGANFVGMFQYRTHILLFRQRSFFVSYNYFIFHVHSYFQSLPFILIATQTTLQYLS